MASGTYVHSCIPASLQDPMLRMTAANAITGNLPTIFIGVVDNDIYPESEWNKKRDQILHLFGIDNNPTCVLEIKVKDEQKSVQDGAYYGAQLDPQVKHAIDGINLWGLTPPLAINVVTLGAHTIPELQEALESLVRGWNTVSPDQKAIQFITVSGSGKNLQFCKNLCLKKLCGSVQVYHTNNYNAYGFFKLDN